MEKSPSKLVPALIGGCVMGVLSSIPYINMGNCLCCMWILLGGGVGAFFYWRQLPPGTEFSAGDGAIVGLLSGIFGALLSTFLVSFFMATVGSGSLQDFFTGILESQSDLSPEAEDLLDELSDQEFLSPIFILIYLFFALIIDAVFGTLGGILGAAIFRKRGTPGEPTQTQGNA
jgi:hypothetical protein